MEGLTPSKGLLNPMERAAEILYGLIMALSFTCVISIANGHQVVISELLLGAVGCNLAWGLVDAVMYLIGVLARKNRTRVIYNSIRRSSDPDQARALIADALPPLVVMAIKTEGLEQIRRRLAEQLELSARVRLTGTDIKRALGLFCLVFFSTFPIVLPFVVITDTQVAIRISNGVAILMMFFCGWAVARYAGFSKWKMSMTMVLAGMLLVALTIVLGG